MKKLIVTLVVTAMAVAAVAVPAKRGVWKKLILPDGTEVRAQLVGDEHGHYWKADDGTAYMLKAGNYERIDASQIAVKAKRRAQSVNAKRVKRLPRHIGEYSYIGKKKGIILLVNFSDTKFKASHDNALFQRIANEKGYSVGKFKGSMRDYFHAQSMGKFELDFDVVGPLTVSKEATYYGANDDDGNDLHSAEMVIEAVELAKKEVSDWKQYDWDGDGYVDQVYVVYAGKGEADSEDESVIWPHAYSLSSAQFYGDGTGEVTVAEGLKVDTYACGSELENGTQICGIGTMCHEFSHCLGYPDFYDIDYSGGQGMGDWDLMDGGCYNGDGYLPAGYTGYERWEAGWMDPVVLEDSDTSIVNMKALQNGGEFYIIYNKRNRDEFFMLENRQLTGWDASLPAAGMLIIHADYDAQVWYANQPNDNPQHQRFTWIPADNKYDYEYYLGKKYYTTEGMETDPFPYKKVNAFNKNSKPAAKLYNNNIDGTKFLDSSVEDITQNADGTISFRFVANYVGTNPGGDSAQEGTLFYESFDQCIGKGGNDGQWSGTIANADFNPDNSGWQSEKAYGADQCAKFGTAKLAGKATTPQFAINGDVKLTFMAGAWNAANDGTTLNLSVTDGTVNPSSVTLTKGEFTDYEVSVSGKGTVSVTFETVQGRFFLDEVLVKAPSSSGIQLTSTSAPVGTNRIYSLDGRYVGTDMSSLPRGLYIVNGKKVVK